MATLPRIASKLQRRASACRFSARLLAYRRSKFKLHYDTHILHLTETIARFSVCTENLQGTTLCVLYAKDGCVV